MAQSTAGLTILSNDVGFKPGPTLDASGRLRVSQLSTIGEYKVLNSNFNTLLLEQTHVGGTFTQNVNTVNMAVAASSGNYAIITSKQYHPYLNGKSQLIELTTAKFGNASNVEKSIGYYSSNAVTPFDSTLDGFRLHKNASDVYSIQIWRNGTNIINITRPNWYDKLDGTGPSGMTIDFGNFNVFAFDFLYLGGTAIGVYVMYNGEFRLVHKHYYANTDNQPFCNNPNHPIRYEVRSTGGAGNMDFICAMVGSEQSQFQIIPQSVSVQNISAGITSMATNTTYAMVGVRKATTFRNIFAYINSFNGIVSTAHDVVWELRLNPTVAGTFNYASISNTPMESAIGVLANTVTGGTVIAFSYANETSSNIIDSDNVLRRLNSTLTNTMDTIVLCVTPVLGSATVSATGGVIISWLNQ